jgi:hypothetical protein
MNDAAEDSGAAHVFVRIGSTWQHQAYLKASNTDAGDWFGFRVTITSDGNIVAVGSLYEDSAATGIDSDGSDDAAMDAGAAYVFQRTGTSWTEAAYAEATNTEARDAFGWDVGVGEYEAVQRRGVPVPEPGRRVGLRRVYQVAQYACRRLLWTRCLAIREWCPVRRDGGT